MVGCQATRNIQLEMRGQVYPRSLELEAKREEEAEREGEKEREPGLGEQ